jgi:hypothetical protein
MNTLKLTNNQTQTLYFWAEDEFFHHTDARVLNELIKITEKDPYNDKTHAPTLVLDYIGDILKEQCLSFIEYSKEEENDVKDLVRDYKVILRKLEQCSYTSVSSTFEKRFKLLSLLCLKYGILEDKMQELADKYDEKHHQVEAALNYYENKIIELLEAPQEQTV